MAHQEIVSFGLTMYANFNGLKFCVISTLAIDLIPFGIYCCCSFYKNPTGIACASFGNL
jgi:hypothetical protein